MFNNPLRKYQSGGAAPSPEQQEMLAAFVEWLPKRIKEFANMQPEQIVEALNGMSKTPEGQKQVQQLMQQFQQEVSDGQISQFEIGGKLHSFLCKHAKGGHIAGCGCKEDGGNIESAAKGEKLSKKEALAQSQETHGFNASQARMAYANAKNALRKSGLRGEALRQAAREMIARSDAQNNGVEAVQAVELPQTLMQVPKEQLVIPASVTKPNYNHMTFGNAFKAAASMADNGGDKTFTWRGKEYGTKRAPAAKPEAKLETKPETKPEAQPGSIVAPAIEDIVIEMPEIEVPTFEKIPVNNAPMQTWAQQKYPMNVDYYIVDPTFWGSDLAKNPSVEDSFARVYKPKSISASAPVSVNLPENYESSGRSYEYYPRIAVKTSVGEGEYSLSEPGVRGKLNEKEQKAIENAEKMPSMKFARWDYSQQEPIHAQPIPSLVYSQKKGGEVEKVQNGTSGIPTNSSALDMYLMNSMQMPNSGNLFTGQQVASIINGMHLNQPLVQAQESGGKVQKEQKGSKWVSADKTIIIKNPGTAQADTTGTYSYPNRSGEFHFAPNGERTLTEWFSGDMVGQRYASPEWFKNHPYKNTLERMVGLGRKPLTPELEENARQRVANRTKSQENGGTIDANSKPNWINRKKN